MTKQSYLVCELDSEIPFAVVKDVLPQTSLSNIELINKVGQAVEDEFCYEDKVKVVHDSIKETPSGSILISFRGLDDEMEEEVRDFELKLTAIY
jgi:hypothetical protein